MNSAPCWHHALARLIAICIVGTASLGANGAQQQKETYVIVHGAWGGGWSFKKTDELLTEAGHRVYRPSLTGQGERHHLASPDVGLSTHVLDVVNTIVFEDLKEVILVGHSYGGMVITGVADSIPERIKRLVYLDAFLPNDGESALTARPDGQDGPESWASDGFIKPAWVRDTDPFPRDVPQSLKTFTEPVSYKKAEALALPATYILTVDDGRKREEDMFHFFAERAKARNWTVVDIVADHNPQMTMPATLARLLADVVNP